MKTRTIVCTIITIASLACAAVAAPQKVNFQGKLTDAAGNPITASVSMVFSIYDHATSTNAINKLWTEPQSVTVTNGIYNVQLGGATNPIDTELTETKPLWLGVKVGADAEMSPRVELTPGVYDLIMLNTITVKNGNVGIGTTNPEPSVQLHVQKTGGWAQLEVESALLPYGANIVVKTPDRSWLVSTRLGGDFIIVDNTANKYRLLIDVAGKTTIYGTLHVTGGADLAEPFDMTNIDSLELGDVVVMDQANPKHLKKSVTAYDHKVAGIVSSTEQAGYVAGSRSDGSSDKPVALTGRVLCKVSAENGAIEVGDLLTTSNTPGYAMKATNRDQAFGAVLGKALEPFDGDTGMILVLVALQ